MTAMADPTFNFICGGDDFLVGRAGRELFDRMSADAADDFSREIISGQAGKVDDVESAVNSFRDAVQTLSLFGGRRYVWLKDVNFLADTPTGRSEGTIAQVEALKEILEHVDPEHTCVLVTAAPIDRRRVFYKWAEKTGGFQFLGGEAGDTSALEAVALAEAREQGVGIDPGALQMLIGKLRGNTRLLVEEVRKLATYLGEDGATIDEKLVAEMVPDFGEGDFFEAADAFFSGDLKWTLDALHRHFFAGGDARPVLSSLQNRNRILIQLKVLIESGEIRVGQRGIDKAGFDRAAQAHADAFGGAKEKSASNVFTQNLWYLGKLASQSKLPALRRMIDNQQEFMAAFRGILDRPKEQEEVLRDMAVRCLA
jgi:DNA polymerase-3 subunit delta